MEKRINQTKAFQNQSVSLHVKQAVRKIIDLTRDYLISIISAPCPCQDITGWKKYQHQFEQYIPNMCHQSTFRISDDLEKEVEERIRLNEEYIIRFAK